MKQPKKPPLTSELFEKICSDLEETSAGLTHVCIQNGTTRALFYSYKASSQAAEDRYVRARLGQYVCLLENLGSLEDEMLSAVQIAPPGTANAIAQVYRVKIDNLKWILSKLDPSKYGNRIDMTTNGENINKQPVFLTADPDLKEMIQKISSGE